MENHNEIWPFLAKLSILGRRISVIGVSLVLMLLVACNGTDRVAKPEWSQKALSSFATYYGKDIDSLSGFNVSFIDSRRIAENTKNKKKRIKTLQQTGSYVLTYVSLGEDVKEYNPELKMKSYYYDNDKDGKPDMNPNWGSIYVNANDSVWHDELLSRVRSDAVDVGADGIFLDTIDSIVTFPDTKPGMISLIHKLREKFPDLKIVANQGLSILDEIAPSIDGLMIESFSSTWLDDDYIALDDQEMMATAKVAAKINEARLTYPMPIFALDYAKNDDKQLLQNIYNRAWSVDFIPYVSNKMLDQVYQLDIKPQTVRGEKVGKEMDDYGNMKEPSQDPANKALASNGASITVDSTFPNYNKKALNDGYRNELTLTWDEIAWASIVNSKDHWVDIQFPAQTQVSRVDIYWAKDHDQFMSSQAYAIQVQKGTDWETVYEGVVDKNTELSSVVLDKPLDVKGIRLFQWFDKGPTNYTSPNIMWISEVEVY